MPSFNDSAGSPTGPTPGNTVAGPVHSDSDPEETRAVPEPASRPEALWGRLAGTLTAFAGVSLMAYGVWAISSDAGARELLARSPSCAIQTSSAGIIPTRATFTAEPIQGTCVLEPATVVALKAYPTRHGRRYSMHTIEPAGRRDDLWLGTTADAGAIWARQKTAGVVRIQRFAAPGYHLTGRPIAVVDDAGFARTVNNPLSPTRPNILPLVLGFTLLVAGFVLDSHQPRGRLRRASPASVMTESPTP